MINLFEEYVNLVGYNSQQDIVEQFINEANAGLRVEKDLTAFLRAGIKQDNKNQNSSIILLAMIGIEPANIKKIVRTGNNNTKRDIDFSGPRDIGVEIADVMIHLRSGENVPISIKSSQKGNIYSGKQLTFIRQDGEEPRAIFDPREYSKDVFHRRLFELFLIDPQRVVDGLNSYINKDKLTSSETVEIYPDKYDVGNLLASAWGYGYWLLKPSKDLPRVKHIKDADDSIASIGSIEKVTMRYPSGSSKQVTVTVYCNNEDYRTTFEISLRNAKGGVLPIALKINMITTVQH